MKLDSLEHLLTDQLRDIYSAEQQIVKALPRLAKSASNSALQQAFNDHLEESVTQIERLDDIAKILNVKLSGKKCKGMEGLLKEGKEVLEAEGNEVFIDAALVAAALRVEHYEIAAYGTARALAEAMQEGEVARLLQETLDEEEAADQALKAISDEELIPSMDMAGETADKDDEDIQPYEKESLLYDNGRADYKKSEFKD